MAIPSSITITIAPGTDRTLVRLWDDPTGSFFSYEDAFEQITLKIRHSQDSPDSDGLVMSRHNVYLERVVFATPSSVMQKYSHTFTMRFGGHGAGSPLDSSNLSKGVNAWLNSGSVLADLAVSMR